jgi:hypothetical protein
MTWTIFLILVQGIAEFGQAIVDATYTRNYPRAVMMVCAAVGSMMLVFWPEA